MIHSRIEVSVTIAVDAGIAWECYTQPEHIVNWNFADPSWHCPYAENDLRVGGRYLARMEARDGSFGFDFDAVYTKLDPGRSFTYEFGGRNAEVSFIKGSGFTEVIVRFDPETENSIERQRHGWQAILNNFKSYTEQA